MLYLYHDVASRLLRKVPFEPQIVDYDSAKEVGTLLEDQLEFFDPVV